MHLVCSGSCGGTRFEPLLPELEVDAQGMCVGGPVRAAAYTCKACGAVAIDIAATPAEMYEFEPPAMVTDQLCPNCLNLVVASPDGLCPNCGGLI